MTTSTLAPVEHRSRQLVLQQLEWDSQVDAAGSGVTARNGVVTLSGVIASYAGKLAADYVRSEVHAEIEPRQADTEQD